MQYNDTLARDIPDILLWLAGYPFFNIQFWLKQKAINCQISTTGFLTYLILKIKGAILANL